MTDHAPVAAACVPLQPASAFCALRPLWQAPWSLLLLGSTVAAPAIGMLSPQWASPAILASMPLLLLAAFRLDRARGLLAEPYFEYLRSQEVDTLRAAVHDSALDERSRRLVRRFLINVIGDAPCESGAQEVGF